MSGGKLFVRMSLLFLATVLMGASSMYIILSFSDSLMAEPEDLRVFEEGNVTYLPIHHRGDIEENLAVISANFALWEETHPDREIVSFQVEYRPLVYRSGTYVNGILIYSQGK